MDFEAGFLQQVLRFRITDIFEKLDVKYSYILFYRYGRFINTARSSYDGSSRNIVI